MTARRAGREAARLDRHRPVRAHDRRRAHRHQGAGAGPGRARPRGGGPRPVRQRPERYRSRSADSAAAGQLTVASRRSVRWPWYADQRLGLLSPSAARELIDGFAPDVVHVHSPLTLGAVARSAARRRRVPVVYTNHYLPANVHPTAGRADHAGPAARAAGALFDVGFYGYVTGFANRCDRVTAPTATALLLLRDHGLRAPSQVVSNGVDLDAFSPGQADESLRRAYALPAGRPLILSVGRLSPEKRADVLIEAVAGWARGRGARAGRLRPGRGTAAGAGGAARRVRAGPLPRLHPRRRPAGPVPARGRVRDRVRGRAAVPGDHGGDGQRAARGRRQRRRARRAGAPGGERLPDQAGSGRRRGRLP